MKEISQTFEKLVPLASLVLHPRNSREGDIGAIVESIKANGFYGALKVQKSTNVVIAGNHTAQAALQAGLTHVPAIIMDVNDEEALRIMLADNKTSDLATYSNEILLESLQYLDSETPTGLEGTGFSPDDIQALMNDINSPMKMEQLPATDKVKRPKYELVFDSEEKLEDFRAILNALKEYYPHHDSVEARLTEVLTNAMENLQ